MPLELHIWGPAFGLPSIDAECLACISYLRQCGIEKDDWLLIPTSDPNVTPTRELPALKIGTLWISRYRNIVDYLRQYSGGEWDLDRDLDKQQRADSVAFSSFLDSRALLLLDLSLYVSSENYTNVTRGTLSDVLLWPRSWTLPPMLRAQAKKRSAHLGLGALDIDSAKEEHNDDSKMTSQIPKSLRKPNETVFSILGKSTTKSQFRLDAVTDDFFAPMEELLESKSFFLGDEASDLDCLAVGYLALMLKPDVPHGFLRRAMKEKYPRLAEWTEWMIVECLNNEQLSWQEAATPTITEILCTVLDNVVDSLPIVGTMRTNSQIKLSSQEPGLDDYEARRLALAARNRNRELYSQIVAATGGIGAFVGYLFWVGMIRIARRAVSGGRRDFGTAGAMLGLG